MTGLTLTSAATPVEPIVDLRRLEFVKVLRWKGTS